MRAKMAFSWEQNCLRRCVFSSGMICSRNLRKTSSMCCLDMNYIKKNSLSSAIIQAVFRYGSHLVLRSDFLLLRRRLVYNHGYHQYASGILEYWILCSFIVFIISVYPGSLGLPRICLQEECLQHGLPYDPQCCL